MILAPYQRFLALSMLLTATVLPKSIVFAQSVATIVQVVKPAEPGLVWRPPEAIAFGTAVSSTELDAKAATSGSFTYLPVAGTILPPGLNTLLVSFKPDNPNFLPGTLTVPISVLPGTVRGFSFVLAPASTAQGPFILRSGKTAPIDFTVAELLNFDQTVTFTCLNPVGDTLCVFTPAASPLQKQPFNVSLVVQLVSGRGQKGQGSVSQGSGRGIVAKGSPEGAAILTSSLFAASIFGVGLRRRRFAQRVGRCWATALAIAVSGLLLGCGSGRPFVPNEHILIVAASPYESHSVEITVSLAQGVWRRAGEAVTTNH